MDILKVKKQLEVIKNNADNYSMLKEELVKTAQVYYGDDILSDFSLPENFNLFNLDENYFNQRQYQNISMPYSNRLFNEMITCAKIPVNNIYQQNVKGKTVQGVYLIGKNKQGKPVLFALSIVKGYLTNKYNIKLDVCPQGKCWINLLRIDLNNELDLHPNFFSGKKVCQSVEDIEYVSNPHLHRINQESQILNNHNLEEIPAVSLQPIIEEIKHKYNNDEVITCLNYFINYCNIRVPLNKNIKSSDDIDFGKYIFSYADVLQGQYVHTLKKITANIEQEL